MTSSPQLFIETVRAIQKSFAIKTAIELEVFSLIAAGATTTASLAQATGCAERGIRILCDFLVICGFLDKSGSHFELTADSRDFLVSSSTQYLGGTLEFMMSDTLIDGYRHSTEAVRRGSTALGTEGTLSPDHPIWKRFAQAMAPMMSAAAVQVAARIEAENSAGIRVLDISASHGEFGIAVARRFPNATIYALDWPSVLELTLERAIQAGVGDRCVPLPGDAFEVQFPDTLDCVLLPNFLHHFSVERCVSLLKKIHAALAPSGTLLLLDFLPNDDRITPPPAAGFAWTMLCTTPEGDAYTIAEYQAMLEEAGFSASNLVLLDGCAQDLLVCLR